MRAVKITPEIKKITEIALKKDPNCTLDELRAIIGSQSLEFVLIDSEIIMVTGSDNIPAEQLTTFSFCGSDMSVKGVAIIVGWKHPCFKSLQENRRSFDLIVEWGESHNG